MSAGRLPPGPAPPGFVDPAWILEAHDRDPLCRRCGGEMEFSSAKAGAPSHDASVSVNRLCNALPHLVANCELMCRGCNRGT